jgi:hypothetical protein
MKAHFVTLDKSGTFKGGNVECIWTCNFLDEWELYAIRFIILRESKRWHDKNSDQTTLPGSLVHNYTHISNSQKSGAMVGKRAAMLLPQRYTRMTLAISCTFQNIFYHHISF